MRLWGELNALGYEAKLLQYICVDPRCHRGQLHRFLLELERDYVKYHVMSSDGLNRRQSISDVTTVARSAPPVGGTWPGCFNAWASEASNAA